MSEEQVVTVVLGCGLVLYLGARLAKGFLLGMREAHGKRLENSDVCPNPGCNQVLGPKVMFCPRCGEALRQSRTRVDGS